MPLSPEAPIPPHIRYTTTDICMSVAVLSISGGSRTTGANQRRCHWQRGCRWIDVNGEVENGSQGN